MPVEELLADIRKWKAASPAKRVDTFFLCKYAFLVSTETKMVRARARASDFVCLFDCFRPLLPTVVVVAAAAAATDGDMFKDISERI